MLLIAGISLSLIICSLYLLQPIFFVYLENKLYDSTMRRIHNPHTSGRVAIVDIDDKSLSELGQFPWPRYRVAKLLEKTKMLGASSVALDIVFSEEDRTSLDVIKKDMLANYNINISFKGLPTTLRDNDQVFAETLANGPFVLGYHFNFEANPLDMRDSQCHLISLNLPVFSVEDALPPESIIRNAPGVICNIPILSQAVKRSGFFNALPDDDGIVRRYPVVISYEGQYYPSLSIAALLQDQPDTNVSMHIEDRRSREIDPIFLRFGNTDIPLDNAGQMLINYRGARNTFPYYSAVDVLLDRLPKDSLENKIVFVGTSASGLKDLRATPLDQIFPGVEVHATVVDNILQQDFIRRPEYAIILQLALIFGLGLLSTMLLAWAKATWSLLPLGGCAVGVWYISEWTFRNKGIYLSPLMPVVNLGANFTLLTLIKYWREETQKRFFHNAFSRYVSKAVVDQMVKSPEKLSLSGEEREVSILFSDIRSFTSMSERLSPDQVSQLLQDYFTPMTSEIIQSSGTLDKFIGDAIMAFWNAPLNTPHHQEQAVRAALGMHEQLNKLNPHFKEHYDLELQIGVGLHAGMVRVGNMGSKDLFDYTIIGDSVNLASRLEGLTKYYGLGVVVSESIRNACAPGNFVFQEVDRVRVKGKALPIAIFTPYTMDDAKIYAEELELYEKAMELYKKQSFKEANRLFSVLRSQYRDLKLYATYQERCATLETTPPGPDWDLVFTHESK